MTKIYTETFGQGKSIVLVHGWAMHSGIWRVFAKELAKTYQVTLIDLPGHGRSDAIVPFTLAAITDAVVDVVGSGKHCWLGWSFGAEVVIDVARHFSERVSQLILLAGTPCFVAKTAWPGMNVQVLNSFAANLQLDSRGTLFRFLSLQIKGLENQKIALQELKSLVFECDQPDQTCLEAGLAILKETDLRTEFANLTIPVALILGQLDTLVPVAVGENMKALLPAISLTVIDRAGHVPFLSHQDAVVQVVCGSMDS